MAEPIDIAKATGIAGGFLTGLWAFLKWGPNRKPNHGGDEVRALQKQIDRLERRADASDERTDKRFEECFKLLDSTRDKLSECHSDVSVAMALLKERRK